MPRYYIEVRYRVSVSDRKALDQYAAIISETLHVVDGLLHPDVGVNYHQQTVTVCSLADGDSESDALNTALAAMRMAVQAAGDSTPGWQRSGGLVRSVLRLPDTIDTRAEH